MTATDASGRITKPDPGIQKDQTEDALKGQETGEAVGMGAGQCKSQQQKRENKPQGKIHMPSFYPGSRPAPSK